MILVFDVLTALMYLTDDPPPTNALVPLQQHVSYLRALHVLGRRARFVSWETGSALLVGDRLPTTIRGPVWSGPPDAACLRALPIRLIDAEDDRALRQAGFRQAVTPATVALWDIAMPGLRASMHGKWRNALTRGEAARLRIDEQPLVAHSPHPLLTHASDMARTRRYRVVSPAIIHAFAQSNPGHARIFTALQGGTALAHMLFMRHGAGVTYQLGWTSALGRTHNAHRVILSHAAQYYAARGCRQMDLGSIDTDHAPTLARFKLGTGARPHRLGGSWLRITPRLPRVEVRHRTR